MGGRSGTRRGRLTRERTVPGPYGPIRVSYDRWPAVVALVEVAGAPAVSVLPSHDLAIDGRRVPVQDTASRWDPRRAARTRLVAYAGHDHRLEPTSLFRGRLTRDGATLAEARGGIAAYSPFRDLTGIDARVTWSPSAQPLDVALGQALITAYGAGAPGTLARAALFWLDWFTT